MTERFDVVVIGSGGLGLSVALCLAHAGGAVLLVDKGPLGSQTSPRAAGLACQVKHDELQTRLSVRSVAYLREFATWSGGVPLAVHQAGGIKVARTAAMAAGVQTEVARGRAVGVEIEMLSAGEVEAKAPYYHCRGDEAAISFTPSDLYLDAGELVAAYVEACGMAGVELRPHTEVFALHQSQGEVTSVETSTGRVEVGAIVDTAGAWVAVVARLLNVCLPVVPVRHQLCVTKELPGITNEHSIVRVVESNVYLRPDRGGLMFGGYEPSPLILDMEARGREFTIDDLPLDFEPLRQLMLEVADAVPSLAQPALREFRGGIPTMTADGQYIIDVIPGIRNCFVVGGCNVAGLTASPAIGEIAARLVMGEDVDVDLSATSLGRFGQLGLEELASRAVWRYTAREEWD
jgi:glycine/D-amino acid oxidase-like deaminating enzyme